MTAINKLLDKALAACSLNSDRALAKRMHVSPSAVSLWRKGGQITEKHLTALIALADVDEVTALEVLAEQAETKPQKAVWSALLQRVGTAAAVALCAIGLSIGSTPKALAHKGLVAAANPVTTEQCLLCKADLGWWARLARWWLAWRLKDQKPTESRSEIACSAA